MKPKFYRPTTNAIMALTVANYLVQPFFPDCDMPPAALSLIAALCICFLTWLNCHSMKVTTSLQNTFMFTKLAALGIVVVVGMVAFFRGKEGILENIKNNLKISLHYYRFFWFEI